MTEAEWISCTDPHKMPDFLWRKASDRKMILFGCACCRYPRRRLADAGEPRITAAEGYADGTVSRRKMRKEWSASETSFGWPGWPDLWAAGRAYSRNRGVRMRRTSLARCVFGNPFRPPPPIDPPVLAWNGHAVEKLARVAYEERRLPSGLLDNTRLAILADALEEAGCTDQEILSHLRGPGPHVRGCWSVDLVLSKS